jgi:anti-sigma regulatory factor (Ser/Thr protein kinase)
VLALGIPLDPGGLAQAQDRIETWLEERGASARIRYVARLAVDELVANLLMHGRFAAGPVAPRLELDLESGGLALAFEDAAAPFDPRAAPPPSAPRLEGEEVGGLGLALLARMATLRDYRQLASGWNRTELFIAPG